MSTNGKGQGDDDTPKEPSSRSPLGPPEQVQQIPDIMEPNHGTQQGTDDTQAQPQQKTDTAEYEGATQHGTDDTHAHPSQTMVVRSPVDMDLSLEADLSTGRESSSARLRRNQKRSDSRHTTTPPGEAGSIMNRSGAGSQAASRDSESPSLRNDDDGRENNEQGESGGDGGWDDEHPAKQWGPPVPDPDQNGVPTDTPMRDFKPAVPSGSSPIPPANPLAQDYVAHFVSNPNVPDGWQNTARCHTRLYDNEFFNRPASHCHIPHASQMDILRSALRLTREAIWHALDGTHAWRRHRAQYYYEGPDEVALGFTEMQVRWEAAYGDGNEKLATYRERHGLNGQVPPMYAARRVIDLRNAVCHYNALSTRVIDKHLQGAQKCTIEFNDRARTLEIRRLRDRLHTEAESAYRDIGTILEQFDSEVKKHIDFWNVARHHQRTFHEARDSGVSAIRILRCADKWAILHSAPGLLRDVNGDTASGPENVPAPEEPTPEEPAAEEPAAEEPAAEEPAAEEPAAEEPEGPAAQAPVAILLTVIQGLKSLSAALAIENRNLNLRLSELETENLRLRQQSRDAWTSRAPSRLLPTLTVTPPVVTGTVEDGPSYLRPTKSSRLKVKAAQAGHDALLHDEEIDGETSDVSPFYEDGRLLATCDAGPPIDDWGDGRPGYMRGTASSDEKRLSRVRWREEALDYPQDSDEEEVYQSSDLLNPSRTTEETAPERMLIWKSRLATETKLRDTSFYETEEPFGRGFTYISFDKQMEILRAGLRLVQRVLWHAIPVHLPSSTVQLLEDRYCECPEEIKLGRLEIRDAFKYMCTTTLEEWTVSLRNAVGHPCRRRNVDIDKLLQDVQSLAIRYEDPLRAYEARGLRNYLQEEIKKSYAEVVAIEPIAHVSGNGDIGLWAVHHEIMFKHLNAKEEQGTDRRNFSKLVLRVAQDWGQHYRKPGQIRPRYAYGRTLIDLAHEEIGQRWDSSIAGLKSAGGLKPDCQRLGYVAWDLTRATVNQRRGSV